MRQIIFSREFDLAVEALGGYRLVDTALEVVIEGLRTPMLSASTRVIGRLFVTR